MQKTRWWWCACLICEDAAVPQCLAEKELAHLVALGVTGTGWDDDV